ncbi:hypothetical protein KIN20_004000 [Parelaphostrongylus tenuis]|uniref:Uncharacterized protein n=1 Tax=Parelaphostrongylus tenuis TaxID=148309 RepID=A0AAD5M003_PARTN|nr:hypothetical protein KIN20_004000 [Parelaphostrongylus tenuis]
MASWSRMMRKRCSEQSCSSVGIKISVLTTIPTVFGCGVMPAGQVSTRPFTVTGFTTLPLPMIYSSATIIAFPSIAPTEAAAKGFVERFVTQTEKIFADHKHHHGELVENCGKSVVDRAVQMLTSGPFGSHFVSATPLSAEMKMN